MIYISASTTTSPVKFWGVYIIKQVVGILQGFLKYLIKLLFGGESSGDVKISKWPTWLPVFRKIGRFHPKGVGISTFAQISYKLLFRDESSGDVKISKMADFTSCF